MADFINWWRKVLKMAKLFLREIDDIHESTKNVSMVSPRKFTTRNLSQEKNWANVPHCIYKKACCTYKKVAYNCGKFETNYL